MFCRIYLSGNFKNEDQILDQISYILELPVKQGYIENDFFSITVSNNDEYDTKKAKEFPDGFLYFQFLIEFDFETSSNKELAINIVGKCLKYFWKKNIASIASCDFEAFLPEKGGYNNLNVPWVG